MDAKAKKILFATYWKSGWIDAKDRKLSTGDFEYAKSQGLMFDPFSIDHDACMLEIGRLVGETSLEQVAAGFLSSLSSRRLDWRSAICSRVIAAGIPAHRYNEVVCGTFYREGKPAGNSYTCGDCRDAQVIGSQKYVNEDLNVLSFERLKWGGVRHNNILYLWFDLSQFQRSMPPEPTREDIGVLKKILKLIDKAPADETPGRLQKRLVDALDSNDAERVNLVEILAAIGVLKPNADQPASDLGDWNFAGSWRGRDRYCRKKVEDLFGGHL